MIMICTASVYVQLLLVVTQGVKCMLQVTPWLEERKEKLRPSCVILLWLYDLECMFYVMFMSYITWCIWGTAPV